MNLGNAWVRIVLVQSFSTSRSYWISALESIGRLQNQRAGWTEIWSIQNFWQRRYTNVWNLET